MNTAINEAVVIAFWDAAEFEAWLDAHSDLRVGLWLKIAKKESGVRSSALTMNLDYALTESDSGSRS
jgi:uncharacterized protein YdeI (YjbR/CyaY-like superfamily)